MAGRRVGLKEGRLGYIERILGRRLEVPLQRSGTGERIGLDW